MTMTRREDREGWLAKPEASSLRSMGGVTLSGRGGVPTFLAQQRDGNKEMTRIQSSSNNNDYYAIATKHSVKNLVTLFPLQEPSLAN
jgi:hypothetical protein